MRVERRGVGAALLDVAVERAERRAPFSSAASSSSSFTSGKGDTEARPAADARPFDARPFDVRVVARDGAAAGAGTGVSPFAARPAAAREALPRRGGAAAGAAAGGAGAAGLGGSDQPSSVSAGVPGAIAARRVRIACATRAFSIIVSFAPGAALGAAAPAAERLTRRSLLAPARISASSGAPAVPARFVLPRARLTALPLAPLGDAAAAAPLSALFATARRFEPLPESASVAAARFFRFWRAPSSAPASNGCGRWRTPRGLERDS